MLGRLGIGGGGATVEVEFSRERAERTLNDLRASSSASRAVIAVPTYYHDGHRISMREAAVAAGWEVLGMINEPTAAALASGLLREGDQCVVVYDLEEDRFDVTVLAVQGDRFEVVGTNGVSSFDGKPVGARDVVELTRKPCAAALRDAGITAGSIDTVVPVGAWTADAEVAGFVESLFGVSPFTRFDPEEVVAIGAAVQAMVLANEQS